MCIRDSYITYSATGLTRVQQVYAMWFDKQYWVKRYNVVEALAWGGKLLVILPAIFFSYEVWWAHIITLITSSLLIFLNFFFHSFASLNDSQGSFSPQIN